MKNRTASQFSDGAAGPVLRDGDNWRLSAACRHEDPSLFHPEVGQKTDAAKRVCAGCPVKAECLAFGLAIRDRWGIFGGLTYDERRPLLPGIPKPYCRKGRHPRTEENTTSAGACRPCRLERAAEKRADERIARTGSSSPRSGHRAA